MEGSVGALALRKTRVGEDAFPVRSPVATLTRLLWPIAIAAGLALLGWTLPGCLHNTDHGGESGKVGSAKCALVVHFLDMVEEHFVGVA